MILASENKFCDEFTERFSDIPKYRILKNLRDFKNGEIVYHIPEGLQLSTAKDDNKDLELRHANTVHSAQGLTCYNNIYIDIRKLKSLRMLYTSISRAKKISQIKFISGLN